MRREWLKEKRIKSGYTMAQMASKLNITESYYSLIEAGERQKKMDIALVLKLSTIFEIPVSMIADLETGSTVR